MIKILRTLAYALLVLSVINCNKPHVDQSNPTPPTPGIATITTIAPTNISRDSAVTGGFIFLNGDAAITESGICYALTANPNVSNNKIIKTVAAGGFSVTLKALTPSTTYYFKSYFINARGTTYGDQYSFKTTDNPLSDSISYVKKIEVIYHIGNPSHNVNHVDYSFNYDNSNRLTKVGMKSYSTVGFDTATCSFFYQGVNSKPYMIVTPNTTTKNPVIYDTVYFAYNTSNQITADSCMEWGLINTSRVPVKRVYSYPSAAKTIVHWFAPFTTGGPQELWRADTINNQQTEIMTQFYGSGNYRSNYAKTETFTYSNYVNPLAKLNIGGTIFSLLYKPIWKEILGNAVHKAVYNSNIIPYYLDFYSAKIPQSFYLGGFTNSGFLIGAAYDYFTIAVTPWVQRVNYPSQITVAASSSYPDDSFIYKFYY
jgi:hypothetical protein